MGLIRDSLGVHGKKGYCGSNNSCTSLQTEMESIKRGLMLVINEGKDKVMKWLAT